jgi:hypothetical protein
MQLILFKFTASLFLGIDKGYGKNSKIWHFSTQINSNILHAFFLTKGKFGIYILASPT